jgi:hypothetical protein
MYFISTSEGAQKGWVMEILSFSMIITRLLVHHALISIRIGNEAVNPYCATLLNRVNERAVYRKVRVEAAFVSIQGFEHPIISVLSKYVRYGSDC